MESCMPASSASSVSQPWIFLSHSGQQKLSFVTPLYHALLHVNHFPFFDQDDVYSLPAGHEYPPKILQACQTCKMGVVVLSEDFVQSLWPMLELQLLLTLPSSSSARLIYPLFYQLQPADLSNPANLKRWKEGWEANATRWQRRVLQLQQSMPSSGWNLDISSWADNLAKLKDRNGTERTLYQNDHDYIQKVVSTICARLPPPQKYSLDGAIKGVERMQQVIADAFNKQEASTGEGDWARIIGVYGIGGSGKSILCKTMTDFFSKEFPGRCFYLEFPSNNNEVSQLIPSITRILITLSCSPTHGDVSDIDEALSRLGGALERNEIFLAIDNIWEPCFGYASTILLSVSKCMQRSKILITGRSKELVTRLLQSSVSESMQHSVPPYSLPRDVVVLAVPSLSKAEAMEALTSYSQLIIPEESLRSLACSCFFQGQCHPLYLKLKGTELRKRGRAYFNHQEWQALILDLVGVDAQYRDDNIEQTVLHVVGKSLDECPPDVQDIFVDIITWGLDDCKVVDLIRMLRVLRYDNFQENAIRCQVLNVLEFHGALEIHDSSLGSDDYYYDQELVIHDLHRQLAMSRASSVITSIDYEDLSVLPTQKVLASEYVLGHSVKASTLKTMFQPAGKFERHLARMFLRRRSPQARIRYLYLTHERHKVSKEQDRSLHFWPRGLHLGEGNLQVLRALLLDGIEKVQEIKGWEGVPNLMWLELQYLQGLTRIEPIKNGVLTKLERLVVKHCGFNRTVEIIVGGADDDGRISLVEVGAYFPKLQHLDLEGCELISEVGPGFADVFPALKWLNLSDCPELQSLDLKANGNQLESLNLSGAYSLERIEGSVGSLTALQLLDLTHCENLETLPDMSNVLRLQKLKVYGGCCWSFFSTFMYVVGSTFAGTMVAFDAIRGVPLMRVDLNPLIYLRSLHIDLTFDTSCLTVPWLNLSHLPSLEQLTLKSFATVRSLCFLSPLGSLRNVSLSDFRSLEEIYGFGAHNVCLHMIQIENCPLLVSIPGLGALPCLDRMILLYCRNSSPQQQLIAGSSALIFPHCLHRLEIWYCAHTSLRCLWPRLPLALKELQLRDWCSLVDISGLSTLKCLVELSLFACDSLRELNLFECDSTANDSTSIGYLGAFPSLQNLDVDLCASLTDVSSVASLTSLKTISIIRCDTLSELPDLRHLTGLQRLRYGGRRLNKQKQPFVSATTVVQYFEDG